MLSKWTGKGRRNVSLKWNKEERRAFRVWACAHRSVVPDESSSPSQIMLKVLPESWEPGSCFCHHHPTEDSEWLAGSSITFSQRVELTTRFQGRSPATGSQLHFPAPTFPELWLGSHTEHSGLTEADWSRDEITRRKSQVSMKVLFSFFKDTENNASPKQGEI